MSLSFKLIVLIIGIVNKGIWDTVVLILRMFNIADIIIAIVGKRLLSVEFLSMPYHYAVLGGIA